MTNYYFHQQGLPILGNLLDQGSNPHQTLHALSQHHHGVMYLKVGTTPAIIPLKDRDEFKKTRTNIIDGRRKKIQVFLTHNDEMKPTSPVLKYGLDLSKIVPPDVKIGFSAATGMGFETHTLLFWDFICTTSWNALSVKVEGSSPVNDEKMKKRDEKVSKAKFISVSVVLGIVALACCSGSVCLWRHYMKSKRGAKSASEDIPHHTSNL